MTAQHPVDLSPLTFLTCNATRAASVKASLTPRFFIAEHSTVLSALSPSTYSNKPKLTKIPQRLNLLRNRQPLLIINRLLLRALLPLILLIPPLLS